MNNNFIEYNQSNIITNPNEKIIYNKDTSNCLDDCKINIDCKGLVISNPICDINLPLSECINLVSDIDILNVKPQNLYEPKCKFISDTNNLSQIYNSNKHTTYLKNKYVNNLNYQIDLSKSYYLKINNKYLSTNDEFSNMFLITQDNIEKACLFKFNSDNNIIETKTKKCLQTNGKYLILTDCDNFSSNQKFIYENKLNSIRPINFSDGNYVSCLGLPNKSNINNPNINNQNNYINFDSDILSDNRIVLEECKFTPKQNIQIEEENISINDKSKSNTNENFTSLAQLEKKIENIEYCSNPIYKSVVFIILIGILIYLIWFVSRKRFFEDIDYNNETSLTPF